MDNVEGAQLRDLKEALMYDYAATSPNMLHGESAKKEECPFAKMGGGLNPHKIAAARVQVPWPLVTGFLLCVLWWCLQTVLAMSTTPMPS